MKELEVKVLDVNVEEMKTKLIGIGANFKWEGLQKIWVFDVPSLYSRVCEVQQLLQAGERSEVIECKSQNVLEEIKKMPISRELQELVNCCSCDENKRIRVDKINLLFFDDYFINAIKAAGINTNKWIRLRSDDRSSSVTVKEISSSENAIQDVDEYESTIQNPEAFLEIFFKMGIPYRNYQEKCRTSFSFQEINFEIDSWPMINPYLEIEAPVASQIKDALQLLGINPKSDKVVSCNTAEVYSKYGLNIFDYRELSFKRG